MRSVAWDGRRIGDWAEELEGAEGVVNLAGAPISQPWSEAAKKEIVLSRVEPTRAIGAAIEESKHPPKVWVNASAIGYYGDTGSFEVSEASPPGEGFLAESCVAWEGAVDEFETRSRKVKARIGIALGRGGGALEPLVKLTRAFLGGAAGNGRQYMSWIHMQDLTAMFRWLVDFEGVSGPVNVTSPNPVTNAVFMRELRTACRRPWSPPVPEFQIRLGAKFMNTEPELILVSQRVAPQIAEAHDFPFAFPCLRDALRNLV